MSAPPVRPVALSSLRAGAHGRVHEPLLDEESTSLLHALGLSVSRRFKLCKTGEPCIVQVGGTRLGVSASVACHILVWPQNGSSL